MIVPTVNKVIDDKSSSRRPNISERVERKGWKMAEDRRYDVPAQKASMADPFNAAAMTFSIRLETFSLPCSHLECA
jgi:hypothetical protein